MTRRDCALAAAFAGLQLALTTGCGAPTHEQLRLPPTPAPFAVSEAAPAWNVAERCDDRASRFAARGLWHDSLRTGTRDELLRWSAHYSVKHGECDVLIEHRLTVADGFAFVYSELWDAFGAAPLAAWTDDPRPDVRRGVCRLELGEHPEVSCRAARYFIDDHLDH
jgi:hypothetical protein